MGNVIAIDVGGTTIKAARYDRDRLVEEARTTPTPLVAAAIIAAISDLASSLLDGRTVAVAVVVPGVVDMAAGVARSAANLGWRDVPLASLLFAELGVPVVLEHDVAAATLAESLQNSGDLLFVSLGTGIAAGHIVDGRVWRGATGQAGEIGHICVVPGGERCACGQYGCLETYASAAGIARRYVAAGGEVGLGSLEIASRLNRDQVAASVWSEAVDALATALATDVQLFDPVRIVIGGGLAEAGDVLLVPLRRALAQRLCWRAAPEIDRAKLGAESGRRGAAEIAWRLADDWTSDLASDGRVAR